MLQAGITRKRWERWHWPLKGMEPGLPARGRRGGHRSAPRVCWLVSFRQPSNNEHTCTRLCFSSCFVIDACVPLHALTFGQVTAAPPLINWRVLLCLKTDGGPGSWAGCGFVIECAAGTWTRPKYWPRPCLPSPLHARHNSVINSRHLDVLPAAQASVQVSETVMLGPLIPLYIPQVGRLWYNEIWIVCCSGM